MFEKEAEKWTIDYVCKDCSRYKECRSKEQCTCKECSKEKWQKGAEFGYNKANEQLTLPKDILGLWEQTVCEIRSEIKAQDTPALVYAKELCDKLEHSMCAVAGGPYSLRYSITD